MKFILELAMKNLTRYKRRTLITAFAIAIGLMMFVIVDSILIGADKESMRNLQWYETASARIVAPQYWEDRNFLPLEESISDPSAVMKVLKDHGWTATERTAFAADMVLYSDDFGEDGNLSVQVMAIDPESDNDVYRFGNTLEEGRYLKKGETDGLLIGSWFAEDIGAKVGYWVTLVTRGKGGFYEAFDMQIVGIINCPNPNVNRSLLMMDKDAADLFLGMDGAVTQIDLHFPDSANAMTELAKVKAALEGANFKLDVISFEVLAHDYLAVIEAKRGGTSMILFLVFIIAAVGVSNTMLMAMYERMRELGMMRAMGMKDRSILLAFLFEAGGIGLIGSIAGLILGSLFNLYLVNIGLNFGFMTRNIDVGFRIATVFKGAWSARTLIVAFVSGIALSMIVAIVPIRRALKIDIPSCLHHQ